MVSHGYRDGEASFLTLLALALLALLTLLDRARSGAGRAPASVALDVNSVSLGELSVLPGIGPRTAARLVARRPFRSLDELPPLLGPHRFQHLSGQLRVESPTGPE